MATQGSTKSTDPQAIAEQMQAGADQMRQGLETFLDGLRAAAAQFDPDLDTTPLSVREAAELLGVRRTTVADMCRAGKIRAGKIGREWRIQKSEINKRLKGK